MTKVTKEGRRIYVEGSCSAATINQLKNLSFTWDGKRWWAGYSQEKMKMTEDIFQAISGFNKEIQHRRNAGLLLKHKGTYACRAEIASQFKGVWDGVNKGWLMPDQESYDGALALCIESVKAAQPGGQKPAKKNNGEWLDLEDVRSYYSTEVIQFFERYGATYGWYEQHQEDGSIRRWTRKGPLPSLPEAKPKEAASTETSKI